MPAVSSASLTRLRSYPQAARLYLAVARPATAETFELDGAHSAGATTLTVKNIATTSAPEKHFTCYVGSVPAGRDKGIIRFRSRSGNTVKVGTNDVEWAAGDYMTVVQSIRPHGLTRSADGQSEDIDEAYVDQNTQQIPLAMFGPPACAFRDGGSAVVNFYSSSVAVASGASLSSYLWTFAGAASSSSTTTPGSAGSPVTATWNSSGGHVPNLVKLTVTDSNGKTHTAYRPVFIFDRDGSNAPYSQVELTSLDGDFESGGWRGSIVVYGAASTTEFPDHAMIVLFADDTYAGERVSIGGSYTHRENIVFVGYIVADTVEKDENRGRVTFEIENISAFMRRIIVPATSIDDGSAATTQWHTIVNADANLIFHHILTEHTTIDHIADVSLLSSPTTLKYLDVARMAAYEQLNGTLAVSQRARLLGDRQGRLYFEQNPQLVPAASRVSTVVADLVRTDIRAPLEINEVPLKPVALIDFVGFNYTGDPDNPITPFCSLAPGLLNMGDGRVEQVRDVRVADQSEADAFSGLFLAWMNNRYPAVSIPLMGNWRVFDIAPQEWATLTLPEGDTTRGITWSSQRAIARQVRMEYRHESGVLLTSAVFELETDGPSGVTNECPSEMPPLPATPEIPPGPQPPAGPGGTGRDNPDLVYAVDGDDIGRSRNFTSASPSWTDITGSLAGKTLTDFILDPWDPKNKAWVLCGYPDNEVWRTTNLDAASPTWTKVFDATDAANTGVSVYALLRLKGSINEEGLFFVMGRRSSNNAAVYHTHDNGSTWTGVDAGSSSTREICFDISTHGVGVVLVGGNSGQVYRSTDGGHSFSLAYNDIGFYPPSDINIPYGGNADDDVVYWAGGSASTVDAYVHKTVNGFSSMSDISPQLNHTYTDGDSSIGRVLHVYTADKNVIAILGRRSGDKRGSENPHFLISTDGGSTWSNPFNFSGAARMLGGWPYNQNYFFCFGNATDGYILHSTDGGSTWADKTGDWASVFGSVPSGSAGLVPVWVN